MAKGFKSKTPQRKQKKATNDGLPANLDTLLKVRYHGAVNIRGIRYQILYSILHSLELYKNPNLDASIRLEGIEDLDYLNIDSEDEYIQVKTADKPWNWAKLKEPIKNFAEVIRISNNCQFSLIINFKLLKDIKKLAERNNLSTDEQKAIKQKFYKLCDSIDVSRQEAEAILGKLTIVRIAETEIWQSLRSQIANIYGLGSQAVDTYIFVLVSKFFNWAETRANISRNDLEKVRISIEEYSAREEYQAYGRGLIDKISWKIDPQTSDFFEGKDTRPGQIAAGVDVRREQWLNKIDKAIHSAGTCILKSSSGQGKSTLMYRYACDYWREEDTLILKAAESVEQAESIKNYLQFRSSLGIPLLLLIDDAGWQTKQWSVIAQECAAVSNAISRVEFDRAKLIVGLAIKTSQYQELKSVLLFLDGIFEGGEKYFFNVNREIFSEAHEHLGTPGSFFLDWYLTAIDNEILEDSRQTISEHIEDFQYLEQLKPRLEECDRGFDLCRVFLSKLLECTALEEFKVNFGDFGEFLDWCYLCEIQLNSWSSQKEKYLIAKNVMEISLDDFCAFSQGLYRYSPTDYQSWFIDNREKIIGYLKLNTDSINLEISEELLSFKFIVSLTNSDLGHSEAKSRIDSFRSAVPFCQQYKSEGIWLSLFQLEPSYDQSKSNVSVKYLPFNSDANKNRVLTNVIGLKFIPDSYYRYQEGWYYIRLYALEFVKKLSQLITKYLTHGTAEISDYIGIDLITKLDKALTYYPSSFLVDKTKLTDVLPQPLAEILSTNESPNNWLNKFHFFFYKTNHYLRQKNNDVAKLALYSFKSAVNNLPRMHESFFKLFEKCPDYFDSSTLNNDELKYYSKLADTFELFVMYRPSYVVENIEQHIKTVKRVEKEEILARVRNNLSFLEHEGITILLPSDVHIEIDKITPLRYITLGFSVGNPIKIIETLLIVVAALEQIQDVADFFCLIPVYKGKRFLTDGWIISANQIISLLDPDAQFNWESLIAIELPDFALTYFPSLPFEEISSLKIKIEILAIFLLLNNLVAEQKHLQEIQSTNNLYEQKLYAQYQLKISEYENNSAQVILELKKRFEITFATQFDTHEYKTVIDLVDHVIEALSTHQLSTLINSMVISRQEQVDRALEKLCLASEI